jgi:hypothetical protein
MDTTRFDLSDPDAVSFCPSCGAGYTARVIRCTDCNEELVPRSRVEYEVLQKQTGQDDIGATVPLCQVENRLKAALLESGLEEAGIRFFVKELGIQPGLLNRGLAGRFEFVVAEQDLERAKAAVTGVEELEKAMLPDEEPSGR